MVKCESLRINMYRITHTGKSVNFSRNRSKASAPWATWARINDLFFTKMYNKCRIFFGLQPGTFSPFSTFHDKKSTRLNVPKNTELKRECRQI